MFLPAWSSPVLKLVEGRPLVNYGTYLSKEMQKMLMPGLVFGLVSHAVPAIGGLVVVGKMIDEYGVCSRLG